MFNVVPGTPGSVVLLAMMDVPDGPRPPFGLGGSQSLGQNLIRYRKEMRRLP